MKALILKARLCYMWPLEDAAFKGRPCARGALPDYRPLFLSRLLCTSHTDRMDGGREIGVANFCCFSRVGAQRPLP